MVDTSLIHQIKKNIILFERYIVLCSDTYTKFYNFYHNISTRNAATHDFST